MASYLVENRRNADLVQPITPREDCVYSTLQEMRLLQSIILEGRGE